MKKLWLLASAAGNVVLLGAVAALIIARREPPSTRSSSASHTAAPVLTDESVAESLSPESVEPSSAAGTAPAIAGSSSRRDLKELVAQLRKAGWPEDRMIQFISSDFYWKRQKEQCELARKIRRGEVDPKAMTTMYQRWQDEMKASVDGLLGSGAYERWEKTTLMQTFAEEGQNMDAATADKLYAAQKEWQKKNQERSAAYQSGDFDPEKQQREWQRQQLDYERKLKEILGDDRYALYRQSQYGGYYGNSGQLAGLQLTDQQRLAAARVTMQFNDRQNELNQMNQAGEIDPQDYQEQIRQLQNEQSQQLRQAIGEDGALRYQQNQDWDFRRIRSEMRDQNFSDAQIDAAFRARQAFNERQQQLQKQSQQGEVKGEDYQASQETLEQDLKTALGDDGYLGYLKAQDHHYRQLKQYAPAWQLSQGDIDSVWETLHQLQTTIQDAQRQNQAAAKQGQQVDWQQAQQQNATLTQQTEQNLRNYLGDDRYNKLKRAGALSVNY